MSKLTYRAMITSAVAALALAATGCNKDKSSDNNATYTSRAYVEALPTDDHNELMLLHEDIADFVTSRGNKQTMQSMSMPFAVGKGVSIDGIAVGDAVEFTFDTDWNKKPVTTITAIAKLPADTKLTVTRPKMPDKKHGGHGSGTGGGTGGGGGDHGGDGDGDGGGHGDGARDGGDHGGGDGSGTGGGSGDGSGGGKNH